MMNPGTSLNFDVQNVATHGKEEEEDAEEARRKEKELKDALATAFDDLIDEEEEDEDDQQYSQLSENFPYELSDTKLKDPHIHRWPFVLTATTSTPQEEAAERAPPNHIRINNEQNIDCSREYYSPEGSSEDSEPHSSNYSENKSVLKHLPSLIRTQAEGNDGSDIQANNKRSVGQKYENKVHLYSPTTHPYEENHTLDEHTITNNSAMSEDTSGSNDSWSKNQRIDFRDRQVLLNTHMQNGISEVRNEAQVNDQNIQQAHQVNPHYGDASDGGDNWKNAAHFGQNQLLQMEILHKARGRELEQCKLELNQFRDEATREIRILKHQLILTQGDKEGMAYSLQQARQLLSDKDMEINTIQSLVTSLQTQLAAEKSSKEEVMKKLLVAESTVESLEKQVQELGQSESLARSREQHESIVNSLKLRHQKEVLDLKEDVDSLRHQLDEKTEEAENLQHDLQQKEKNYHKEILEKGDIINRLSQHLEASQKQCHNLLESGTVQEASHFKMQLHQVELRNAELDRSNVALKEEIKSLQTELETFQMTHRLLTRRQDDEAEDSIVQLGLRKSRDSIGQKLDEDLLNSLKSELERSLTLLHSRRSQVASLQEQLSVLEKELAAIKEGKEALEQRAKIAEDKASLLQKKVDSFLPQPISSNEEKNIQELYEQKKSLEFKLEESVRQLQEISLKEEKLNEIVYQLKSDMSSMVKEHDLDKQKALQKCRESCLQLHQDAFEKLRSTLLISSAEEKQKIVQDYEEKILQLNKEIEDLNKSLDDVKALYIRVCEEKNILDQRLTEIMASEESHRQAFEANLKEELETKYNADMKQFEEKTNNTFKARLEEELADVHEMWIEQKTEELEHVLSSIKAQYEKQRDELLQKEGELEKKNSMLTVGLEKLKHVHQEFEKDKESSLNALKEQLMFEWDKEKQSLMKHHDVELDRVKQEHKDKLQEIVNMMQETFKKQQKSSQNNMAEGAILNMSELNKLEEELASQKISWQKEKGQLVNERETLQNEVKNIQEDKHQLKEKLKKYQHHIQALGKQHEKELQKLKEGYHCQIGQLENKVTDLQAHYFTGVETRVNEIRKQHEEEISAVKKKYEEKKRILDQLLHRDTKHSATQTTERTVYKEDMAQLQRVVLKCLKKIRSDVTNFLAESSKRASDRLQRALLVYHQQLVQRILQETIEDNPLLSMQGNNPYEKPQHSPSSLHSNASSTIKTSEQLSKHFASSQQTANSLQGDILHGSNMTTITEAFPSLSVKQKTSIPGTSLHNMHPTFNFHGDTESYKDRSVQQSSVSGRNVNKTLEGLHSSLPMKQKTSVPDVSLFNMTTTLPVFCAGIDDDQRNEMERSVVSETSTEFMHLPQQTTTNGLLAEVFRTIPSFWADKPTVSGKEMQSQFKSPSHYPEKLSSRKQKDLM